MAELPFEFLEKYFKNQFEKDYNSFRQHCIEDYSSYPEFKVTDEYCEYYNPHSFNDDGPEPGLEKIYFIRNSKHGLKKEIERSMSIIEQEYLKRLGDRNQLAEYQKYLEKRIHSILRIDTIKDSEIAKLILSPIENKINELFQDISPSTKVGHSFRISSTNRDPNEILSELYTQLDEHSIIEGSIEEFINAFTGQAVNEGIKWMILSRNKKSSSKYSLFYFLFGLADIGLLSAYDIIDINKIVEYVFRDLNGKKLNGIRDAKSKWEDVKKVAKQEELQAIIESISL